MVELNKVEIPKAVHDEKTKFDLCDGQLEGYVKITRDTHHEEWVRLENVLGHYGSLDQGIQNLVEQKEKIEKVKEEWKPYILQMEVKQKELKLRDERSPKK